jgi:outer membrane immunogenic protein
MGRLRSVLLVCVVVAAAAPAAFAADMPLPGPAPTYAPPPPARYDWSGVYFGIHVGAGLLEDTLTSTTTTSPIPFQSAGAQTHLSPAGIIGGAQAGFNYQFNSIVLGVEGTWTDSAITGSQVIPSPLTAVSENSTDAPLWYATATGRAGYAINDVLLYAKGGAAWMNAKYTQQVVSGAVISQQSVTNTRHGYTVGGGIEYAFTENLSVKLEYDYLNFGTRTYGFNNLGTAPATAGASPVPVGPFPVSIESQTHMLLFVANYRFNWGGHYARY